jgi:hypothetical protein
MESLTSPPQVLALLMQISSLCPTTIFAKYYIVAFPLKDFFQLKVERGLGWVKGSVVACFYFSVDYGREWTPQL